MKMVKETNGISVGGRHAYDPDLVQAILKAANPTP